MQGALGPREWNYFHASFCLGPRHAVELFSWSCLVTDIWPKNSIGIIGCGNYNFAACNDRQIQLITGEKELLDFHGEWLLITFMNWSQII